MQLKLLDFSMLLNYCRSHGTFVVDRLLMRPMLRNRYDYLLGNRRIEPIEEVQKEEKTESRK